MKKKITSEDFKSEVTIEDGELISFQREGQEYIHQKGSKGWRSSDDEMFPIIGPTSKNNFTFPTAKGDAILDQHRLLRELNYLFVSSTKNTANFIKKYKKNTLIKNSKFPEKSSEAEVFWPYDFSFQKNFTLEKNVLKIQFIIESEEGMPFMLGYHPAFLLSDSGKETIISDASTINLESVLKAGSDAFPVFSSEKIVLKNVSKNDLEITTKGFDNFMLWTEVKNMLCIEPITQYPSNNNHKSTGENWRLSKEKNFFSVAIKIL